MNFGYNITKKALARSWRAKPIGSSSRRQLALAPEVRRNVNRSCSRENQMCRKIGGKSNEGKSNVPATFTISEQPAGFERLK
jgi:hypothetical protein